MMKPIDRRATTERNEKRWRVAVRGDFKVCTADIYLMPETVCYECQH